MSENVKRYRFICDPGHGWLEVPMMEIIALGIKDKISGLSYRSKDRQTAYLEEDCDASVFHNARTATGLDTFEYDSIHEETSTVRPLPGFHD